MVAREPSERSAAISGHCVVAREIIGGGRIREGFGPLVSLSGARLARLALNLLPLYEVDALPSATTLLRSATPAARRLARG